MRRSATDAWLPAMAMVVVAAAAVAPACAGGPRSGSMAVARAACPRDSERDASGRCACTGGTLLLLGACVPPAVGDAFCGPAAMLEADGCVFRTCRPGEELDVIAGRCVPAGSEAELALARGADGGGVTCPRGSKHGAAARTCEGPARCPPGSLADGDTCCPVVTERPGGHRVDLAPWAAIALGIDGGPGSRELCQPIEEQWAAFGLGPGEALDLPIAISLTVPDEDVSRLHALVRAGDSLAGTSGGTGTGASAASTASAPNAGSQVVSRAVDTILEALRGLGGEASAAALELRVRCAVRGAVEGTARDR